MSENDRETKNAIFAAKEAAERAAIQKGIPTSTFAEREAEFKKSLGLDIPVSAVPLPSLGKIYPSSHPCHMQESVDIRGMTTREEDLLMSKVLIKNGTVITKLIEACLVTPGVDVQSLIGGDRNALMISIRALGYGVIYEAELECPKCNHKNKIAVNLNELDIKELSAEPVAPGENRFEFVLPKMKKKVEFKFITGREEEEIIATMEMRKKKGMKVDNVVTTKLQHSIISIDGNTDRGMISQIIPYIPAQDSMELRKYMDSIEPGIDMKFDFNCSSCEHYEVMPLPLGPTFFWPNA